MTQRIWSWLKLLTGVGILAVLAARLGTRAFLDGLRVIDTGTVLAALGIGLLTTVFSAWRWCLVARGLGLRLPLGQAVADYYRALLLNAVLPAGVLGDVDRAVRHGRDSGDVGRGVRAVVLERTAGQLVVLTLGGTLLLARPTLVAAMARDLAPDPGMAAAVLGGLAGLALLAVLAVVLLRRRGTLPGSRGLQTALADARRGLLGRGTLPGVILLSAAGLAGHLSLFLVAARAAGSTAPTADLLPPMMLALLVMGLPINVGGWGPREAASALAFGAAGLGAQQGLATAVVYGVLATVAALPGAAVLLLPGLRALAGRRRAGLPAADPLPLRPPTAASTPLRRNTLPAPTPHPARPGHPAATRTPAAHGVLTRE